MSYQLIEKQVIFEGQIIRLEVHRLRDEATDRKIFREVVIHPGAAVVLPFLDDDTIILIRNRRYVIDQILLELPAGTLRPGELPMNGAGRELLEETGYLAGRMQALEPFYSSPGILSERIYSFAAYDLKKRSQALEAGEEIEITPTRFDAAIELIRAGQITDGKTIATLLYYDRFHRVGGRP